MFCKNCGNEVHEKAIACPKCGVNPRSEKNFCHSCGTETNSNQVVCIKCGVSLKNQLLSFDATNITDTVKDSIKVLSNNKSFNKYAVIIAAIGVISVFLPWIEVSSSSSFMGYSSNYSTGDISGIKAGGGIIGLIVFLAGIYFIIKNDKRAFLAGVINSIDGIGYMFGWFGSGGSFSFEGGSARSSVDPKLGLYLFVISALIFAILTYKKFKNKEIN